MAGSQPPPWSTEGPVQAEVFVLWRNGSRIELTGPCGADAWYMEVGEEADPVAVVAKLVRAAVGEPLLVHSTSWRRARGSVILSFVVVIPRFLVGVMSSVPIERTALARSDATAAPAHIAYTQVIEHGLRHLAWLAKDDSEVRERLDAEWLELLTGYVPEPFRHLDRCAPVITTAPPIP